MPVLPTAANNMKRDVPTSSDIRNPLSYNASQEGIALARAGQQTAQLGAKIQDDEDNLDAAYANSAFTQEYIRITDELENDPDYTTVPERYNKSIQEAMGRSLEMVRNPRQRQLMQLKMQDAIAQGGSKMKDIARTKRLGQVQADVLQSLDESSSLLLSTKDPAKQNAIRASVTQQIAAAQRVGALDAKEAYTIGKKWKDETDLMQFNNLPDDEKLAVVGGVSAADGKQPLSVRNNNPGNIRDSSTGEFRKYATPEEGMRAMRDDLRVKISGKSPAVARRFGKNYTPTLETIIGTYAPPEDNNDTAAYIKTVSEATGLAPDAPLTAADIDAIMPAMIKVEGGHQASMQFGKYSADVTAKIAAERDKIVKSVMDNKMAENPSQFIVDVSSGTYDGYLDEAAKLKAIDDAAAFADKQIKQAENLRLAQLAIYDKGTYDQILAAPPKEALRMIGDARDTAEEQGKSTEFWDKVRDGYIKRNPLSEQEKQDVYSDILSKREKIRESTPTLEEAIRYQQELMVADAQGVGVSKFINEVAPVINKLAEGETGSDDPGLWWFGLGDTGEAYDAGYDVIQDFLRRTGKEDDTGMKVGMMKKFVSMVDSVPEEIRSNQVEFDKEIRGIAKRLVWKEAAKSVSGLLMLDDAPNGAVRSDGSVMPITSMQSDLKPDTKVTDSDVRLVKDASGNQARVYYRDGKKYKAEYLDKDGAVTGEEVF